MTRGRFGEILNFTLVSPKIKLYMRRAPHKALLIKNYKMSQHIIINLSIILIYIQLLLSNVALSTHQFTIINWLIASDTKL